MSATTESYMISEMFEMQHESLRTAPSWLGRDGYEEWTQRWLQDNDVKNGLDPLFREAAEEHVEKNNDGLKVAEQQNTGGDFDVKAADNLSPGTRGAKRVAEEQLKKEQQKKRARSTD